MSSPSGSNATQLITLGIFLKILGFFVVLFSYTELEPIKNRQVESSLQSRFGINLTLAKDKGGLLSRAPMIVQQQGRAYDRIRQELLTQIDFISTEDITTSDRMRLVLPADIGLSLKNNMAKSPQLPEQLVQILKTQKADKFHYQLLIKVIGRSQDIDLMRALGEFAQKFVASGYSSDLITIGIMNKDQAPELLIEIRSVPS